MHKTIDLRARREKFRDRGGRREHDQAMADHRVAAEHRIAIDRARARGNPGCPFCDGDTESASTKAGRFVSRLRRF
jgi:hypothetical protein